MPLVTTPAIVVPDLNGGTRTVTPPLAPPPAPVGAIAATFSVSDRGSATYTIPIAVPPGRSIQPALALRYASSSGNGALGAGWSLDGLSQIARCQRTFAQDGYTQPVLGTAADAYCLDGQRLVPVSPTTTGRFEYRTAVDTFTRVIGVQPDASKLEPDSFVAYTKDGRVLTFDGFGTSYLPNQAIGSWALTRVQDRVGNFMTITYQRSTDADPVTGQNSTSEVVPLSISYGGHGNVAGDREIRFFYTPGRSDAIYGWRPTGAQFKRMSRLSQIGVYAAGQEVRGYVLHHEVVRGTSRLTSIEECTYPSGICKPATTFEYASEFGFGEAQRSVIASEVPASAVTALGPYGIPHQSGTGHDVIATATIDSWVNRVSPFFDMASLAVSFVPTVGPFASAALSVIGSTVDKSTSLFKPYELVIESSESGMYPILPPPCGRDLIPSRQLLVTRPLSAQPEEKVVDVCPFWTYTGALVPGTASPRSGQITMVGQKALYTTPTWYLDVDGDGLQDRLTCASYPPDDPQHRGDVIKIAMTKVVDGVPNVPGVNDTHFDTTIPAFSDSCKIFCSAPNDTSCHAGRPFSTVFDVNGDGTSDLIVADTHERMAALIFDGVGDDGLLDPQVGSAPLHYHWRDDWFSSLTMAANHRDMIHVMDVNGDGLRDLVALADRSVDRTREGRIAYNTGHGFEERPLGPFDWTYAAKLPSFVVDYDHDGTEELLEPSSEEARPWRLRKFTNEWVGVEDVSLVAGPGTLGDFDGDGNLDAWTKAKSAPGGVFMLSKGVGRHDHLLKSITDGLGRTVDIEYDGPGDAAVDVNRFQNDHTFTGSGWPLRVYNPWEQEHLGHALVTHHVEGHFVAQQRQPENHVVDRQSAYGYGQWANDVAGYGPLGFATRTIEERDSDGTNLKHTIIDFDTTPPASTDAPYIRPLAGLPIKVIEVLPTVDSRIASTVAQRTDTTFQWEAHTSSVGVPFPALVSKTITLGTDWTSSEGQGHVDEFVPTAQRIETTVVDAYGNVTDITQNGDDVPPTTIHRDFSPTSDEVDSWLISLRKSEDVTSGAPGCTGTICDQFIRHRHDDATYYPGTVLPHVLTRAPGDPALQRTTTLIRDTFGNVTQTIVADLQGNVREVDVDFDERGLFPLSVTRVGNGTSQTTQVRYDERFGTVVAAADPNGIDSTWSYDEFGVERSYQGPDGETTSSYEAADYYETTTGVPIPAAYRQTSSTAGGETQMVELNALGQVVRQQVTGLLGAEVFEESLYDWRNRLVERTRSHVEGDLTQGSTEFTYDDLDRVVIRSDANGGLTRYDYGLSQWVFPDADCTSAGTSVIRVTDADGRITSTAYSALGLPLLYQDRSFFAPSSDAIYTTQYVFGAFNDLIQINIGENLPPPLDLERDDYGRVVKTRKPYGGTEPATSTYNGLDEVVHTVDPAGRARDLVYDGFGRLDHYTDADGLTQWTYDDDNNGTEANTIGRLVETLSPSGQRVHYRYQGLELGRNRGLLADVTEYVQGPGVAGSGAVTRELKTSYSYDDASRLTGIDYPAVNGPRFSVAYGFDSAGHTIQASNPHDTSDIYWQLVGADQGVRPQLERSGGAACGTEVGTTTNRTYDPLTGELTDVQATCGSNVLQHLSYTYTPAGKMWSRGDHLLNNVELFNYDSAGRIERVNGDVAFSYASNRHGLAFQAGVGEYGSQGHAADYDPNLLWTGSAGDNTYWHDDVGAQRYRTGPGVSGGSQRIDYTTFDLPTRVLQDLGYEADFTYDASYGRATKATGLPGVPSEVTFYRGELYQRTERADGSVKNRNMIYAGGRLVGVATNADGNESPALHYAHDDVLGSIHTISDSSGGVETRRDYGVFGRQQAPGASFADVPFGYTGQEEDADLGLVNMKGRIYDPVLGEFLSPDPYMPNPGGHGLNSFNYVLDQPLDMVDPSGFSSVWTNYDTQAALAISGFGAAFIGGPACAALCGSIGSSIGTWAAGAASTVASGFGAIMHVAAPAVSLMNLALHSTNPVKHQGFVSSRSQTTSTTAMPTSGRVAGDPIRPITIDPGPTAVHEPDLRLAQNKGDPSTGANMPGNSPEVPESRLDALPSDPTTTAAAAATAARALEMAEALEQLFAEIDAFLAEVAPILARSNAISLGTLATGDSPIVQSDGAASERAKNIEKGIPEKDLGPSGKPKIHNVEKATKKAAREAAENAGAGKPLHHPTPATGKPHFHPTDITGRKIPGTHYNYPR